MELLQRIATEPSLGAVRLEARASSPGIRWLVGLERPQIGIGTAMIKEFTGARLTKPSSERITVVSAGRSRLRHPALSLTTDRIGAITRSVLAALAQANRDGDKLVVQIMLGARRGPHLVPNGIEDPRRAWWQLLWGTPQAPTEVRSSLKERASRHGFQVEMRIGAAAATPERRRSLLTSLFGALRVAEAAGTRLHLDGLAPATVNAARRPGTYWLTLSVPELLPLLGWPLGEGHLPGVPAEHPRLLPAPAGMKDGGRAFAETTAPGTARTIGIPIQDAAFHTVLLGPTGSGKSTAMLSMIVADMEAGRGVLVVDPKADLVADVLERVPAARRGDVVVIDPLSDRPVGINVLAGAGRSPELVADSLMAALKGIFDNWGIRSEDVLGSALLTLARTPGANLLWLPTLLTDPTFRRRITSRIDDPLGVSAFWARYDELSPQQQAAEIGPAMNKLRVFLIRPGMRAVLGQSQPRFDLAEVFSMKKIVLISLNKGILGPEFARLLGSLIVGSLWPIILGRGALPQEKRTIASLYVDEVQDYLALPASGDLAEALAQSRSLGAAWHLAHQYRDQLPPAMRAAIDTNARSKIVFGLEQADAAALAKTTRELDADDFQLLPTHHVYANLRNGGKQTGWLSAATTPPSPTVSDPIEIRQASAERYGRPRSDVDETLRRDLGLGGRTVGTPQRAVDGVIGRRKRP
ncbi:type IV secretion system DNA-binding domain-containing protein [Microbacteriaceae bacterium VKM Ac-2854]|nr:type IV secretion system DNA-binding domain-containing protein [Microbacteriaceae bacterium VKM Ac-2854]